MENSIKELIELATSSGTIKQESRDLIYQKAEEKGISKTECDIYIENALNVLTKVDGAKKAEKNYRGLWLFFVGIGDFIWGVSCMDSRYTEDIGIFGMISGTLFMLVGAYIIGWLNVKLLKKIGFFLLSVFIANLIAYVVCFPFNFILNMLAKTAWNTPNIIVVSFRFFIGLLFYFILFIVLYIFRHKILGENASKVEITKLNTFLQPILNKLPTFAVEFLQKV